jgi:N-acetylglucosaminyl-diphospho-decaprenol L-rhamnosyltransferase
LLISVILVSYNTSEMSIEALNSLFSSVVNFDLEVFIVDNASKDNSAEHIKKAYPNITLIENKANVGFGRANNQVLDLVKGDYVLLLNTDAFVQADTLQKSAHYMLIHPNCGVLGVKLLGRDGELQPSCRYFPTPFNLFASRVGLNRLLPNIKLVDDASWNPAITQTCDWVPGCYYLVRKEVIQQVGLFDPLYFLYCEEVDHCFATKKAGWDVTYLSDTSVVHIGGESAKSDHVIEYKNRQINTLRIESELLYFRKNHGLLGALSHIFFTHVADFYDLIKSCLRLQLGNTLSIFKNSALFWQMFIKTRFAKHSTR